MRTRHTIIALLLATLCAPALWAREAGGEESRDAYCDELRDSRKLDELLKECNASIEAYPNSKFVPRWKYLHAESLFRLWRFKEAEDELKAITKGDFVELAQESLSVINPGWKFDAGGIKAGYAGKYLKDVRFQRVLAALPETIAAARATLKDTLGVEIPADCSTYFAFEDAVQDHTGDRAFTTTFCRDYQPASLIIFYTEFIVIDPQDFALRLAHELKHAAFRHMMGQEYLALPQWIKEGLAVYGARQTDDRVAYLLCQASRNPLRLLDGIAEDDRDHNGYDYLEDALCFEWLESLKAGNVAAFCKRLLAGEDHRAIFADLTGTAFDKAMAAAEEFCRKRCKELCEPASEKLNEIVKTAPSDFYFEDEPWLAWFNKSGRKAYEAWLKDFGDTPIGPRVRYWLGRGLICVGEMDDGRQLLARVRNGDRRRCSYSGAAAAWIAASYALAKDAAAAKREYGVFYRDYSWVNADNWGGGALVFDGYAPAGPVTEEDEK